MEEPSRSTQRLSFAVDKALNATCEDFGFGGDRTGRFRGQFLKHFGEALLQVVVNEVQEVKPYDRTISLH